MVAEQFGVDPNTIGSYERGDREPTLELLIKLARFFDVSIDDLLTKDMQPAGVIFGRNLNFLRKSLGINGKEIAKILGVSPSTYSKYENGLVQPDMDGLVTISEFFGVTIDDLLKKDLSKVGDEDV